MRATIPYIQERFDKYNALCFEGKLPPIAFKLSKARTFLGRIEYKRHYNLWGRLKSCSDYMMRISTCYDLPEDKLDDIIIHEMIHYWIAWSCTRDRSAHGPVFRSMMKEINNKFGRHITISTKVDQLRPESAVTQQ